jgi:ferrous iron transport protein A
MDKVPLKRGVSLRSTPLLSACLRGKLNPALRNKVPRVQDAGRSRLIKLKEGEEAVIVSILGGRMATKRLADLGLSPGIKIKVLRKAPFFGPVEIEIRGSTLVLGQGLAAKVLVEDKNENEK